MADNEIAVLILSMVLVLFIVALKSQSRRLLAYKTAEILRESAAERSRAEMTEYPIVLNGDTSKLPCGVIKLSQEAVDIIKLCGNMIRIDPMMRISPNEIYGWMLTAIMSRQAQND